MELWRSEYHISAKALSVLGSHQLRGQWSLWVCRCSRQKASQRKHTPKMNRATHESARRAPESSKGNHCLGCHSRSACLGYTNCLSNPFRKQTTGALPPKMLNCFDGVVPGKVHVNVRNWDSTPVTCRPLTWLQTFSSILQVASPHLLFCSRASFTILE